MVELEEGVVVFVYFFGGFEFDEEFCDFGFDFVVVVDVYFLVGVYVDDVDVFDFGFGVVVWVVGDC